MKRRKLEENDNKHNAIIITKKKPLKFYLMHHKLHENGIKPPLCIINDL